MPVVVGDWSEEEEQKILATLDPVGVLAERDNEQLAGLMRDIEARGDSLLRQVWPEYIIDTLLAAEWTPPAKDNMPQREAHATTVSFSPELWSVVNAAIERERERREDPKLGAAEALAGICERV
jgi:hypothetical protein